MRFSFAVVLAVCAPLLALTAPIPSISSAPTPTGGISPNMYSPGWKREVVHEDSVVSTDWKRDETSEDDALGADGYPPTEWKRNVDTDFAPVHDWKRDVEIDTTNKDWKA